MVQPLTTGSIPKGCGPVQRRRHTEAPRAMAWMVRGPYRLQRLADSAPSLLFVSCTARYAGRGCPATFLLRSHAPWAHCMVAKSGWMFVPKSEVMVGVLCHRQSG